MRVCCLCHCPAAPAGLHAITLHQGVLEPITVTPPTFTLTLGAELERVRLRRRAERMTIVVAWLRQDAGKQRREPGAPRHVRRVIADFEAEIQAINVRLGDLAPDDATTHLQALARVR
jgi:hypothetical protein